MSAADHGGQLGIPMPDPRAPRSEWAAFAVSQGMPAEMAKGMTRDQIRIAFLPPNPPLGGEPDLERHERDPDTLAAIREGRRRPWERA
jgi:hypothetical protein